MCKKILWKLWSFKFINSRIRFFQIIEFLEIRDSFTGAAKFVGNIVNVSLNFWGEMSLKESNDQ